MAMFQPFKPTQRGAPSKFTAAAYNQGLLNQRAQEHENAVRGETLKGAKMLFDSTKTPIGNYLRSLRDEEVPTAAAAEAPTDGVAADGTNLTTDASMTAGADGINEPGDWLQSGMPGNTPTKFDPIEQTPEVSLDPAMQATKNSELGGAGQAGEATLRDDITAAMNGTTDVGGAVGDVTNATAGIEGAGDATEMAGELTDLTEGLEGVGAATDAAEGVADAAGMGSNMVPGLGTISSLAEGDVGSAAAKFALGMLPPPYNMLAMLV